MGNLSFNATQDELHDAFAGYGDVTEISIVNDRETGRPRGFAFVSMRSREEMDAAIEGLNGRDLGGRTLTVNEARPREERGFRR